MGVSNILNNSNTLGNAANLQSLGAGTGLNILGANIPLAPLISSRDYFLAMLETWLATPNTNNQFVVIIETFPNALVKDWMAGLVDGVTNAAASLGNTLGIDLGETNLQPIQQLEPIGGDTEAWANNTSGTLITAYPFQRIIGCIFAQSFDIPDLDVPATTSFAINNNGGFMPGVGFGNRAGYAQSRLTLEFLETNTSFTDTIVRPWMMLASHYGMVARNPDDKKEALKNIKTNILIMEYTKSYQGISQIPRKVWHFLDCAPVSVGGRQNVMDPSSDTKKYKTQWLFRKYNLKTNLYLPIPDLLNKISSGSWNDVLAI